MVRRRPSKAKPDLLSLTPVLERLYRDFNRGDSATDPVHVVRRFLLPADREVVGFLAAGLAFGRVASVLTSIERVLAPMGQSPARFVADFDPRRDADALRSVTHRWMSGVDLVAVVWMLKVMLQSAGSIERYFLRGLAADAEDVTEALESFTERARAIDLRPAYGRRPARPGAWYFFARPSSGGACKRLNLFLRWMVRRDAVDLGVWAAVSPALLLVPLDTHVVRVGRCLGLTRLRTPGWRMTQDITASLRRLDPGDPVRYDFSLCHLGMMKACGNGSPQGDSRCPLRGVCRPRRR